ncbi:hypothetical protein CCR97_00105 [Rhodoplanes elegans]|uniref:SHSP domain-containing protein n=1 Tax=Rhodoplanes elegans TaxID=29408 RepID=A0A327KQU8_9BRAD|nr:hypothetical protein [Rhodoplanes elegans]RAI41320.1 hypothetical protein CH338_03455 [Rhodoplanes elegans]
MGPPVARILPQAVTVVAPVTEQHAGIAVALGHEIRGEKQEDKEEKKTGYHLRERHFGSFERHFRIPEGVDADKIDASFKKGVLTVTRPKAPGAQKPEKKIEVKAV